MAVGISNPWHRNKNTVRTKPRKPYGKGPVTKGVSFGRCRAEKKDHKGQGRARGYSGRYT